MLYGDIIISHLLCLILCTNQYLIQCLADINLAAGHLGSCFQMADCIVYKMLLLDFHFLNQF